MVRPLPSFVTRKETAVVCEKWAQRLAHTTLPADGDQPLLLLANAGAVRGVLLSA
jgi:hypothetical protein